MPVPRANRYHRAGRDVSMMRRPVTRHSAIGGHEESVCKPKSDESGLRESAAEPALRRRSACSIAWRWLNAPPEVRPVAMFRSAHRSGAVQGR